MDFLESAAVLIPVLTGIEVTIYTASQLETYLKRCADDQICDLIEPLGSRLMVFKASDRFVLLGPYVEEGWDESAAYVGYPDNNYFSKVFKANQGFLPRVSSARTGFLDQHKE